MNRKLLIVFLAGSFLASLPLPLAVQARGGPGGQGGGWRNKNQNQFQNRQRLRDGSCQNQTTSPTGSKTKKERTNGFGDDKGNTGRSLKDETGSGRSSQ